MSREWLDVGNIKPRIAYTATASQTAFTVPFVFFEDSDLYVYKNTTLLTLSTHYTVTGAEEPSGGTVTLVTGATVGDKILITRRLIIEQTTHIPPSGPLDVPAINVQISKLVAIAQQLDDDKGRSVHFPDNDPNTSGELASSTSRAGKLLGFGNSGELIYPLGPSYVAGTFNGVAEVDSKATAQVTSFSISVNVVRTGGAALPGDGGGGEYKRVVSLAAGAPGFQSADGAWWQQFAGTMIDVDTRTTAIATTVAATINAIQTGGYTAAGDGGAAIYKRVASDPGSGDRFQSADGAWWQVGSDPALFAATTNVSGSAQTTTGTISAASTSLTLAAALDFRNGQGIRVNHAGTSTGIGVPSGLTVTPTGAAGATTYTYTVAPFTATGGYGPAITAVATATGNATLSSTNYNALSWAAASGAVGYAVYGRTAGSLALLAFVATTTFNDMGTSNWASQTAPDWMPGTPPVVGAANWLVTTILSGGGTTSLTLAATATTSATAQTVLHDDTVALQAALTAAVAAHEPFYIGGGIYRITSALTATGPLQIYGNGPTIGVQAGSIVLSSPTQDGLSLSGQYISLHDFAFQGGGGTSSGQISGSLIKFNSVGAVWIERIISQYAFKCVAEACWRRSILDQQLLALGVWRPDRN